MVKEVGNFSKWGRAYLEKMLLLLSKSKTFNALQVFKKIYPDAVYDEEEIKFNQIYPNNLKLIFRMACDVNDIELMQALIDSVSKNDDITPAKKKEIIKSMLEQEHIDYYSGCPLLVYAVEAEKCNIDMVQFLINTYKKYVDNDLLTFINATNDAKATALMLAVFYNKFDVANYLIKEGANVNLRSVFGGTALFDTLHKDVFWGGQTVIKIRAQKKLLQASLSIADTLCGKLDNLDAKHHEMGNILKAALDYFCQSRFSAYQDYSESLLKIIVQHVHKMTAETVCDFLSSDDKTQLLELLNHQDLQKFLSFENIGKLIANNEKYSEKDKIKVCKAWLKLLTDVSIMEQTPEVYGATEYARKQLQRYDNMKSHLQKKGNLKDAQILEIFMQYKTKGKKALPPLLRQSIVTPITVKNPIGSLPTITGKETLPPTKKPKT